MISKIYVPATLRERYKGMKKQPKFPRGVPQHTMTHPQLVDIAHRWVLRNASCGAAFMELKTSGTTEIPDVIGFGSGSHSVMVECKSSRSDFLADKRKQHAKRMGRYRFYCAPAGLIRIEELPEGYGLIQVNEKGKIAEIFNPFDRYIGCPPSFPKGSEIRHPGHDTCMIIERNYLYSAVRRNF